MIDQICIAFGLSLLLCALLIPFLRRRKMGQNILSYVKEHSSKAGTPTMGGLAFVPAALCACLLFSTDRQTLVSIAVGVGYLIVGCLDDSIKLLSGQNQGLTPLQKICFQVAIALVVSAYAYKSGVTTAEIPFFGGEIFLGAWSIPLYAFVLVAAVNCVNLTDGLDGLAASSSIACLLPLGLMADGLSPLCFCLVGALAGYLVFNTSKASLFMGDTGSLSLGGFIAVLFVLTGKVFFLPFMGLPFVLSGVSVLLQVAWYKLSGGKRIFLMAPVHHHFQKKGFAESKISYAYFIFPLMLGLICLRFR